MSEMRKCDYCGRSFDFRLFQSLENGSEACPECVEDERENEPEHQDNEKGDD